MNSRVALWVGSIGVGLVSIAPYLVAFFFIQAPGGNSFHFFYQDSERIYLSRIREIVEGHITAASPVFFEYKETPVTQQPFGEWLYAITSLGESQFIPVIALFSKFLFPALFFCLVYLLSKHVMRELGVSRVLHHVVSFALATLILLGYEFNNILGFWGQILSGEYSFPHLSLWTRLVNPITGAIGLFFVSYFFLSYQKTSPVAPYPIAAGILLGLLSGYVFSFALAGLIAGIFLLFSLLLREWAFARVVGSVLFIAICINASYFISIFSGQANTVGLEKMGLLHTHVLMHNKVLYLAMGMFVLATFFAVITKRYAVKNLFRNRSWQWSCAVLVSSFLCYAQQVVTGQTVWPGHFVQYTIPLSYIVFFTSMLWFFESVLPFFQTQYRQLYTKGVLHASLIGIVLIICVQMLTIPSVFALREEYRDSQRYAQALLWLEESVSGPCVVFPVEYTEVMGQYITAYTSCDVYASPFVFVAIPPSRILHNYIVRLRLLGVTESTVDAYLEKNEDELREYFFNDWVDKFGNGRDAWLLSTKPIAEQESFIPEAKKQVRDAFLESRGVSVDTLLKQYHITHIMVDTKSGIIPPHEYTIVFEKDGISLYKVSE